MTTADYHLNNSGATYSSGGHHDRLSEGNSERKKHMRKFAKSTTTNSELLLPNLTEANRIVFKDKCVYVCPEPRSDLKLQMAVL